MKFKRGMKLKSKTSNTIIQLISKKSGNRHWNTKKLNGGKSHMVHEGTLEKFYEEITLK